MLNLLRSFMENDQSVKILKSDLACVVEPFLKAKPSDVTPKELAEGFDTMRSWIRIGFHLEKEKGQDYLALEQALKVIATRIGQHADDSEMISLQKKDLAILADTYQQIEWATKRLMITALEQQAPSYRAKRSNQDQFKLLRDFDSAIPVYNRPNEPHHVASSNLETCAKALEDFLMSYDIAPASYREFTNYVAPILKRS